MQETLEAGTLSGGVSSKGGAESFTGEEFRFEVGSFGVNEVAYNDRRESVLSIYSGENDNVIQRGAGTINELISSAMPRRRKPQCERAYKHYEFDDLLQDLIKLKLDFGISGLRLQATTNTGSPDDATEFQNVLNEVRDGIDLDKLTYDLMRDWYVTDSMILYWRDDAVSGDEVAKEGGNDEGEFENGIPGISGIHALNPACVDWENSLGMNILKVDIPVETREFIKAQLLNGKKNGLSEEEIIQALIESGIQRKWIEAAIKDKGQVTLDTKDGDNWIIRTRARQFSGLAKPSMKSIFLSLELRRILVEGDFSTAFLMKHFIMLIKAGESITQGPMAGQDIYHLKDADKQSLLRSFSVVNKAMRVAANHTTTIEFIFPPKEMFDPAKFDHCEKRIFNWAGVAITLVTGGGSNYAGGYISVKKTISDIDSCRREIGNVYQDFFRHKTIKPKLRTPKGYKVSTRFDNNVLKEPRALLDEVKFLFDSSISNARTTAQELGRDPDELKAGKIKAREENDDNDVWEGVGTQGQFGFSGKDPGGRPTNDETERTENTRTQRPKVDP